MFSLDYLTSQQNSVAGQSVVDADVSTLSTEKPATTTVSITKKRTSQAELLAGAVKRKRYFSVTDGILGTLHSKECRVPTFNIAIDVAVCWSLE